MQADKIEHGQTSALSEFVVDSGSSRDRGGDRENGDRSHRRRTRSPRGDDDRDRRSSRRYDDDRSYSRRHDDDDRRRRDGRDRDHRDYRDRDNRDRRDRDRDYDRRDRGYDRHRDDRRDRDRDRDDRRGDRRGGGGGGYGRDRDDDRGRGADRGVEVFGAGNANRSPTPEGTIPISKRRRVRTGWDIKAPGFENFTAMQAKMTGIFNLPGQVRPMNASMTAESAPNAPLPELHLGSGTDMSSMAGGSAAYARQARRLYVGNITFEATEMNVAQFFNHQMRERGWANDSDAAGVQGPDPVVSVQVNHEKSYAFVEFRSAAEASAAMGFDGIVFQGQVLKIRRPKDYVGNDHSASTHIPGVVSTNVPDTPNKIFIGGLPSYLNDVQVMELLQTFGELRAFNLVKEGSTNQSKGFAFCEYVDPSITDIACQGLNGMELGDRYLVVQRAAIGANAGKQGQYSNNSETAMSMDLSKLAPSIISAATAGEAVPTRVMQMLNMVTMDDLINDQDYEDLLEDIKEECGKYGNVVDVKIPRPVLTENGKVDQKASDAIEDLMKVFVMYDDVESVKKAMMNIAGRKFGGRSVICAYADEEKMV